MIKVVGLPNNSSTLIINTAWIRAGFVNYKKGALDSQPQVIKFTSCLPMVGGSLRVLRLLPPLKNGRHDIADSGVKHQKSSSHKDLTVASSKIIKHTFLTNRCM
jgi:hypothetical protein